MEKQQIWFDYNNNINEYFMLALLLAAVILCLVWVLSRLRVAPQTTAIIAFVAVRVPFLFQSLWYDEAFTAWLVNLPFGNMIQATAGDVHPPLWYVIEWAFVRVFGNSDWVLRLPALVLSAVVAWQFPRLCRRLEVPDRAAWVGFVLLALLPFSVRYGAEARMYELLLVLVMAMILTIEGGETNPTPLNAIQFGLLGGLAMLTHNMAVIYVVPFTIYFLLRRGWRGWPVSIGWLIYWPWFPFALAQLTQVNEAFWVLPVSVGSVVGDIYTVLFGNPVAASLVAFPLVLAAIIYGATLNMDKSTFIYSLGPITCAVGLSLLGQSVLVGRVLIGVLPLLIIYAAQALVIWWDWLTRYLPLQPLGRIGLIAGLVWVLVITPQRSDWAGQMATVPVQAGDTCYHISPTSIVLARRYVPACRHIMWPHASNLEQHLSDATKTAMQIEMLPIDKLSQTTGAVWLWFGEGPYSTPAEVIEAGRIKRLYPPLKSYQLFDLDIANYTVWELDYGHNGITQKTN